MLKIFFIFIAILFCTANYTFAATPTGGQKSDNVSIMYKKPSHDQMRKQFEQRLNLTDKQKEKAAIQPFLHVTIGGSNRDLKKGFSLPGKTEKKAEELERVNITIKGTSKNQFPAFNIAIQH